LFLSESPVGNSAESEIGYWVHCLEEKMQIDTEIKGRCVKNDGRAYWNVFYLLLAESLSENSAKTECRALGAGRAE
jgi:hypothetical protein